MAHKLSAHDGVVATGLALHVYVQVVVDRWDGEMFMFHARRLPAVLVWSVRLIARVQLCLRFPVSYTTVASL